MLLCSSSNIFINVSAIFLDEMGKTLFFPNELKTILLTIGSESPFYLLK